MNEAFDIICRQDAVYICLFVDGLDECECDRGGRYLDIVSLYVKLIASSNIKACLSSCPWLVFENAFRSTPSLELEFVTMTDIERYVKDHIQDHDKLKPLAARDPKKTGDFVQEILSKALGRLPFVQACCEISS